MKIVNTTPYLFHPFDCSAGSPGPALSLLIKGTFKLQDGQSSAAADEQKPFKGDQQFLDDLGRSTSYASDLVPLKTRGEVTLLGSCHTPQGAPRGECDVSLTVGPIHKMLRVSGERHWSNGVHKHASSPKPFSTMPLRWELAYGSLADRHNPLGRGVEPTDPAKGEDILLPNVEYADKRVVAPTDKPPPAGFGPIAPHCEPRLGRQGTRDQRWAAFRAPLAPADFDPRYHNAAPDDQQLPEETYFRGDEPIVLENLHRDLPRLESSLPGKRLRLFLWLRGTGNTKLWTEVELRLDTVHIAPDDDELVLVWRRPVKVSSAAHPEILAAYLAEEDLATEPAPAEVHYARFRALNPERPSEEEELQAHIDTQMADAKKSLKDANIDPKLVAEVDKTNDPSKVLDLLMGFMRTQSAELDRLTAKVNAKNVRR